VTARFKVAGIRNEFAGGVEGGQEISNPVKTSYTENKVNSVTPTNLVKPTPQDVFSGTGYISSVTHVKSKSVGLYFVDTVHLGRFFEASGGVRWDYFDTLFNLYAPPTAVVGAALTAAVPYISQTVQQPSYRAALVFKPDQHGSVYFDYGTSFNPSAESLSLSVSSSVLPPEENETFEVGAKYSLLRERLQLEGAWFHTEKDNARETDPTNSNNIVLAGNQLVKGVQASAVGRLGGGTDLVLGYAYLSSQVLYSKLFPTSIGFPLANVPRQTFNAFVTHNLPLKLNFGLGGNYVAARLASSTTPYVGTGYSAAQAFASAAVSPCGAVTCYQVTSVATKQVPGYWVFNAMIKRPITDRIELQANVYNLLNRFYIDQPHPSHLIPGAGLSALIGASWRF
jgi:catecholate siderophore receptor